MESRARQLRSVLLVSKQRGVALGLRSCSKRPGDRVRDGRGTLLEHSRGEPCRFLVELRQKPALAHASQNVSTTSVRTRTRTAPQSRNLLTRPENASTECDACLR